MRSSALSLVAAALTVASLTLAAQQPAPPVCAIDMGSNSFRRLVGTFRDGRYDQRSIDVRRLGVGDDVTEHGRISAAKLAEIEQTLRGFKADCDRDAAAPVVAVGTAAFRDAPNGRDVVAMAARHGIAMEVASEARESELAYLVGSLGQDGVAVIDNGSRSIELVAAVNNRRQYRVATLGYRVAFDRFFAKAADLGAGVSAFRAELIREAGQASFMRGRRKLVGVEFAEMAEILFKGPDVEGRVFTRRELEARLAALEASGQPGFAALKATPDIDHALPRLVAAVALMQAFGYDQIELTGRELGAGLIIEAGLRQAR